MSGPNPGSIDMTQAQAVLVDVTEGLNRLDGEPLDDEQVGGDRRRRNAEITRELLYLAHLAQVLQVAVLNEYHRFKGQQPPQIVP